MGHISDTMARITALFDKHAHMLSDPTPNILLHCNQRDKRRGPTLTPYRRERIIKMRSAGVPLKRISDIMGCSTTAVWRVLNPEKDNAR